METLPFRQTNDDKVLRRVWEREKANPKGAIAGEIMRNPGCPPDLAEEIWNHEVEERCTVRLLAGAAAAVKRNPEIWKLPAAYRLARLTPPIQVTTRRFS